MTSRLEKERAKQIQDKCQALLTQMLRDEDNKYCVDCDAKGPRWASWNLGVFLCIRCAGIHRNLGVHISKVKSVNLDSWTPEQVVSLQQMGNSRARAVYEANIPDSFRRPQTDCSLENFIRAKYEHKKYIAREWVPPPLPKVNWDKELDEEAERQRRRKKESSKSAATQNSLPPVKKPEVVPQLPKPHSSVSPKLGSSQTSATQDLLGLDTPTVSQSNTNGTGDDIFSSFLSAPPVSSPQLNNEKTVEATKNDAAKTEEENFFNQPAPSPAEKNKMTKDSILALYGTPSPQTNVFGATGGMFTQQPVNQFQQQATSNMLMYSQQNSFANQQSSLSQINAFPQQMPVNQNQMLVNPSAVTTNTMAMQMGQLNGIPSAGIPMQSSMMTQSGQTAAAGNSNGWSGMLGAQNLQPAPGSNPFINLTSQQQPQQVSSFTTQLPQQISQMSIGGMNFAASGKPTAAMTGQTLSTNLWQ
ncbi:stromal membrane-associated protein 1 [Prorops nasuta]|uniref:stromal membrane-associated protein 1 n=1 Tax=Prorops nasuta TaxID=863751 RepID=UPI0034CE0E73